MHISEQSCQPLLASILPSKTNKLVIYFVTRRSRVEEPHPPHYLQRLCHKLGAISLTSDPSATDKADPKSCNTEKGECESVTKPPGRKYSCHRAADIEHETKCIHQTTNTHPRSSPVLSLSSCRGETRNLKDEKTKERPDKEYLRMNDSRS